VVKESTPADPFKHPLKLTRQVLVTQAAAAQFLFTFGKNNKRNEDQAEALDNIRISDLVVHFH